MPYTKKHDFDELVIDRINDYIKENHLSPNKIAKAAGMNYQQLYRLRNKAVCIKLREYVNLCQVFREPFEKFLK